MMSNLALFNYYDFPGKNIALKFKAACVKSAGLGSDNITNSVLADAKGTEAVWIADGYQLVFACRNHE